MQVHQAQPNPLIQYGIMAVVVAIVFAIRARRMSRLRPLKIEQLWIVPALYLVVVAGMFVRGLPTLAGWGGCVLALGVGAALGWQRGKTMHIEVDPETHALNQKASMAGLLFLLVLIVVKVAAQAEGNALHLNVVLLTEMLGSLALGMFAAMRVEMYLRAKRLLGEARAASALRA